MNTASGPRKSLGSSKKRNNSQLCLLLMESTGVVAYTGKITFRNVSFDKPNGEK